MNDKSCSMAKKNSRIFSFAGQNIKKIRQAKNISQFEFAGLFGLSRPSVGAYEEGRSEPKIETIIQISKHFNISIDLILTRKLTTSDIFSLGLLNKKLNEAHNIEPPKPQVFSVPFVGIIDYVNYIVRNQSKDFIETLPKVGVPFLNEEIKIIFELEGNEMEFETHGLHYGDLMFCKPITNDAIAAVDENKLITIITSNYIKTRRITYSESNSIVLKADNPIYEDFRGLPENILQLWEVVGIFTANLKPPSLIEKRLLLIEDELKKLKTPKD